MKQCPVIIDKWPSGGYSSQNNNAG